MASKPEVKQAFARTIAQLTTFAFLYADGLILMFTSPEGLQRQLNALASFCEQRQLTVNLSKSKVVIFEARKSDCKEFVFSGINVDRHEKAVHAMQWRCISLHLSDPATVCKLFDVLMLLILSYSCELWAVNFRFGAKAELVCRQFLQQLLGVRKSTTNQTVLIEFGCFPLQIHCSRFCVITTGFVSLTITV